MSCESNSQNAISLGGEIAIENVAVLEGGETVLDKTGDVSEMGGTCGTLVSNSSDSGAGGSKRKLVEVKHGDCEPALELPKNLAELVKLYVMDQVIPFTKFLDNDSARQLVGGALQSMQFQGEKLMVKQKMTRYWGATQRLMIDQTQVERKAMRSKYARKCKQGR